MVARNFENSLAAYWHQSQSNGETSGISLAQTKGGFDKKNLQILYEYEDKVAWLTQAASPFQREGLISEAAALNDFEQVRNPKAAIS